MQGSGSEQQLTNVFSSQNSDTKGKEQVLNAYDVMAKNILLLFLFGASKI